MVESIDPKSEWLRKLYDHLPFSVNAIDSILNHTERTEIYELKRGVNSIYGVVFNSSYNPHIWYSPIIWFFGLSDDKENLGYLFNYFIQKYKTFIGLSELQTDLFGLFGVRTYSELLMIKNKSVNPSIKNDYKIRLLETEDAEQSIRLSSDVEPGSNRPSNIECEKLFLRERETYGIFLNDTLVCRGSIMANVASYSTVGGFVTDPNYRGMGLAKFLVNYINEIVEYRGYKSVLTVRKTNQIAISLYQKLGFEKMQEVTFIDAGSGVVP